MKDLILVFIAFFLGTSCGVLFVFLIYDTIKSVLKKYFKY